MALKAMPIWLILGLDVMEFLNSRSLVKNVWIIRLDLTRIKKIWSMKRWMFEDFNLSSWHWFMKRILYLIVISIVYAWVNYGIYSGIGWIYAKEIYFPVSLSTIFLFYVIIEVVRNPEKGIKSRANILLSIFSIALFVIAFLMIWFWILPWNFIFIHCKYTSLDSICNEDFIQSISEHLKVFRCLNGLLRHGMQLCWISYNLYL